MTLNTPTLHKHTTASLYGQSRIVHRKLCCHTSQLFRCTGSSRKTRSRQRPVLCIALTPFVGLADLLDTLEAQGYQGPLLEENTLGPALEGGLSSPEYFQLLKWLTSQIKLLGNLEESVSSEGKSLQCMSRCCGLFKQLVLLDVGPLTYTKDRPLILQILTVLFGDMLSTTLNMDQRKQRKELSQELRMKIIDKHVKGKPYKTISKQLDVPVTTVVHIIKKFKIHGTVANLPGRGRRRKIDDKSERRIIGMVTQEPRKTSKEIKGELEAQGTSVSDRTIRRCLSQSGLNGRRPRRTPLLKTNHKKVTLESAELQATKETDQPPINI